MNPVSIEKQKLKNDRTEMTIEIHRQKLEKLALEKHNEERRSGFMVWDKLNEIQIEKLENETTCDGVKELLKEYFNIKYDDLIKTKIATDLFFYSYAFCKDRAFNSKCTSTFMSIMYEIFIKDSTTTKLSNNMNSSSEYFKSLLLKHSVERPPSSIKIFTDNDVLPIMTFVIERYCFYIYYYYIYISYYYYYYYYLVIIDNLCYINIYFALKKN
jgi:hypothetical protein